VGEEGRGVGHSQAGQGRAGQGTDGISAPFSPCRRLSDFSLRGVYSKTRAAGLQLGVRSGSLPEAGHATMQE